MVKIPTYDSTFKKRTLVKDTYSGFSGGEIQVASQRADIDFKSLAGTIDKYDKVKKEREGKRWEQNDPQIQQAQVEEVRSRRVERNCVYRSSTKRL